ncbi:unnamed protein product [Rotaria magnacalcarata]|uniref:G-protein coupled receptors family 1 profile domain-containing protein n=1 Tax=Rotaria magnacalcarata TaxID=392030 RepID=A0A816L9H7_9BILA|nr:unnamed protein product [Rotaria magnacalcarata]
MDRTLCRALHNHIIIGLLILDLVYELTNILLFLRNDYYNNPWSASPRFYLFWVFFDYARYPLQITLFTLATVERHIVIFHDKWIATRKRHFLIHCLSPCIITIYYFVYYSIVYFSIHCETPFNSFSFGGIYIPCAFDRTVLAHWELMFHQVTPTLLIMFGCMSLFVRVMLQKTRARQQIEWRKHRKMILQVLTISSVYIAFNLPWIGEIFPYEFGLLSQLVAVGLTVSRFIIYNIIFFCPFVCFLSFPELRTKFTE